MKKKSTLILFCIIVLTIVLAGCGNKSVSGSASKAAVSRDSLRVASRDEPKSLDPVSGANDGGSTRFKHLIFDTLLTIGTDKSVEAGIVESWEYKDDTTLLLNIRKNVKFHNGYPLTAKDVLYTINRAAGSTYNKWMVDAVDQSATKIIDENTVEVKLTRPAGAQLAQFCFLYVVSEQYITEVGDETFAEKPVGTGPFILKNWFRGDRLEFATNKDYWGKVAQFDNLIMRIISESSSRAIEVESGGVDVALDIIASDVEVLSKVSAVKLLRSPSYSNVFIGFNCAIEPFKSNVKLRQAISYAVDKRSIVQAVFSGIGSVATGPISPAIWGYTADVTGYTQNVDKAKALLTEAGYPNGLEITLTSSDSQERVEIAEILQNQVRQIGITFNVETLENATYLDRIINRSTQMYILGWTTNTGDADYGLYDPFYTGMPSWANTAGYSNPRVDALLDTGRTSTDVATRMNAYVKAQQLIVEEAPWIFLYDREEICAVRSNIEGLVVPASSRYRFNTINFTD